MATLEHFLKTGQLDPIRLGMTPFEVASLLGDPQEESRKKNPLLLKYGGLQLTFWKKAGQSPSRLAEIAIYYQPSFEPLPLMLMDWNPTEPPTEAQFLSYLDSICCLPVQKIVGGSDGHLTMPSGVRATFSDAKLHSLQLAQRRLAESAPGPLTDEREPSTEQILQLLDEATIATQAGALRAGLVLAWAGLEAVLRRAAVQAALQSRIGVQPTVLIRELQATGNISPEDFEFIEQVRQLRTAIAHGLAPKPIDQEVFWKTINLARRLLVESGTRQPALA
jgi:hypothetical protein